MAAAGPVAAGPVDPLDVLVRNLKESVAEISSSLAAATDIVADQRGTHLVAIVNNAADDQRRHTNRLDKIRKALVQIVDIIDKPVVQRGVGVDPLTSVDNMYSVLSTPQFKKWKPSPQRPSFYVLTARIRTVVAYLVEHNIKVVLGPKDDLLEIERREVRGLHETFLSLERLADVLQQPGASTSEIVTSEIVTIVQSIVPPPNRPTHVAKPPLPTSRATQLGLPIKNPGLTYEEALHKYNSFIDRFGAQGAVPKPKYPSGWVTTLEGYFSGVADCIVSLARHGFLDPSVSETVSTVPTVNRLGVATVTVTCDIDQWTPKQRIVLYRTLKEFPSTRDIETTPSTSSGTCELERLAHLLGYDDLVVRGFPGFAVQGQRTDLVLDVLRGEGTPEIYLDQINDKIVDLFWPIGLPIHPRLMTSVARRHFFNKMSSLPHDIFGKDPAAARDVANLARQESPEGEDTSSIEPPLLPPLELSREESWAAQVLAPPEPEQVKLQFHREELEGELEDLEERERALHEELRALMTDESSGDDGGGDGDGGDGDGGDGDGGDGGGDGGVSVPVFQRQPSNSTKRPRLTDSAGPSTVPPKKKTLRERLAQNEKKPPKN